MSNESQIGRRKGFWSGMPIDLKGRAVAWVVYYLISAAIFTQNAILGIALLVAPGLWYLFKNWFSGQVGAKFDVERKDTLSGYTVRYLWNASIYTRAVMVVTGLIVVVGGLGWISTEDLRVEAAKPTITERVTETAGAAVNATKDKTSGWIEKTKSWFE